jgi:hypothetical protein
VVGLIFGLPHLLVPLLLGPGLRYTPLVISGVSFVTIDETYSHGARVREVRDGRLTVSDASVYEHRADPTFFPFLPDLLLGLVSRLTGVPNAFILADFLLPPVVLVLLYWLFFELTRSAAISVLGSLAILFGGVRNSVLVFGRLVAGQADTFLRPFEFSRFPTPELTFIPFAATMLCLVLLVERRRTGYALAGGVLFGSLFYCYPYYWGFVAVGGAILGVMLLGIERDRELAGLVGLVLLTGAVISIPYWVSHFQFRSLPDAEDILSRIGIERTLRATLPSAKTVALGLVVGALYRAMRSRAQLLLCAFMLGSVVCQNMQLVVGYNVYSPHWNYRVVYVWQTVMSFAALKYILSVEYRSRRVARLRDVLRGRFVVRACAIGAMVVLAGALTRQALMSRSLYRAYTLPAGFQEAFDWLSRTTPRDSVVMSSSFETNMLLPVYTHNKIFLPTGNGLLSLSSTEEILDRLVITYCLYQVPYDYAAAGLTTSVDGYRRIRANEALFDRRRPERLEQDMVWYVFHLKFVHRKDGPPREIREAVLHRLRACGEARDRKQWRYRVDYAWESPLERQKGGADLSTYRDLEKVYEAKGVRIFRFREIGG